MKIKDPPTYDDGVAEYLALWLSNGVAGSEPTGLMFHPNDATKAIVSIQHPASGNDALFEIKFTPPRKCGYFQRIYGGDDCD